MQLHVINTKRLLVPTYHNQVDGQSMTIMGIKALHSNCHGVVYLYGWYFLIVAFSIIILWLMMNVYLIVAGKHFKVFINTLIII